MMRMRLKALEHPAPESVDINDEKSFASTILWLEDQKIRHYKIEDRNDLRKVDNLAEWDKAYRQYKKDVGMPKFSTPAEEMCWFLSYAVRLEYLDVSEKYTNVNSEQILSKSKKSITPSIKTQNSFDKLDFNDKNFINGVRFIANKLNIAYHPNHLIQLEAVKRIVKERLGKSSTRSIIKGKPFPFEKGNDFICDDPKIEYAVRILRLLQIQSLRNFQTKVNEAIVTIQNLTADPKTDTKLGCVGY